MAEIQKIGHWFFAADRVMTISRTTQFSTGETIYLYAAPLPVVQDGEEYGIEELEQDYYPTDVGFNVIGVEFSVLDGSAIICDIPDNCALFIGDAAGEAGSHEGEEVVIHWSKR